MFVAVNITELLLIWWQNRPPRLDPQEAELVPAVAPDLPAAMARTLLAEAEWRDADPGTMLTEQGRPVGGLIYLSTGTVDIVVDGRAIDASRAGGYLGEMSWVSGAAASATVTAREPLRYAWFDRSKLGPKLKRFEALRFALQASIIRNLTAKLMRATGRTGSRDMAPDIFGGALAAVRSRLC